MTSKRKWIWGFVWVLSVAGFSHLWMSYALPKRVETRLNSAGFCVDQNRYLTDEEFVLAAISRVNVRWKYVEVDPQTGERKLTSINGDIIENIPPQSYEFSGSTGYVKSKGFDSVEEILMLEAEKYFATNANCCEIAPRVLRREWGRRHKLTKGHLGKFVRVTHPHSYETASGDFSEREVTENVFLTNCGVVYRGGIGQD